MHLRMCQAYLLREGNLSPLRENERRRQKVDHLKRHRAAPHAQPAYVVLCTTVRESPVGPDETGWKVT